NISNHHQGTLQLLDLKSIMFVTGLMFCLMFMWTSSAPEPNVNVNVDININGESAGDDNGGPKDNMDYCGMGSCNLGHCSGIKNMCPNETEKIPDCYCDGLPGTLCCTFK
ncbi:unnamed protein product, partial [Meganyctiphanes norvegica]